MSESSKESKGYSVFWVIFSIVLLLLLGISFLINLALGVTVAALGAPGTELIGLHKKTIEKRGTGDSQILVINLKGVISSQKFLSEAVIHPDSVQKQLKQATDDPKIKAVILKITSPGGEITASDKIYRNILEFREKTKKPVIAYLEGLAASGGYYIAAACDEIIVHPMCITGSIGVIMSFMQFQKLMEEKLGIKYIVIKSGEHKDLGSFARDLTEQEKVIFQEMITEMYERFLEVVTKARPVLAQKSREELLKIADGRIYTGKQAYALGLTDYLDYWEKAVERSCTLAKLDSQNIEVLSFDELKSLFQEILASQTTQKQSISEEIVSTIWQQGQPQLY